jgi:6-phosphogluconolactonase (cycloisomerase 2 family)
MEMSPRMCKRFTWPVGVVVLVLIGFLLACGSHYSSSSDGLVIVPSQGSAVMQSFSFGLSNGSVSAISKPPATNGQPTAVVVDPAGTFAYTTLIANSSITGSVTAASVASYKINTNGTLTLVGSPLAMNSPAGAVSPVSMTMDSTGKFLFVADQATTSGSVAVAGAVSVFSIGSGGALAEVAGSPFAIPASLGGASASPVSVAVTPMVFPAANAVCSPTAQTPPPTPTTEYLYAADATNNKIWEFQVDTSSGVLGPPSPSTAVLGFATGSLPSGIAVDPCNRFVFVSNLQSNNINGYSICNGTSTSSATCAQNDGSLVSVGAPVSALNGPGPMVADPFGNFLYVVDTLSNAVSAYHISPVAGTLSPASPATVATGSSPVAIAIRNDDTWLFVTNYNSANVSQFAITPASGALTPSGSGIATDNFPWGIAVK